MALKLLGRGSRRRGGRTFNRTIMALKRRVDFLFTEELQLLIVPLWHGN